MADIVGVEALHPLASFAVYQIRDAATTEGLMPLSKYKRILIAVTNGWMSQWMEAVSPHLSKRDVSTAVRIEREHSFTFEQVSAMDVAAVDGAFFPGGRG